jgi:predicted dehydrogenase
MARMHLSSAHPTRREFLSAAAALAVPVIVPASALGLGGQVAPSQRITVGLVGCGSRGVNLLDSFLAHPDSQLVAVCDVHLLHYRDNAWGQGRAMGLQPAAEQVERQYAKQTTGGKYQGCRRHNDFRELCGRKDLDVVAVATPDHWHALMTLCALREGKDVYCEKPVTHLFCEGQWVYREVARRKAVFQAGSQQRSDARFQLAVEIVRNGLLGKVRHVDVGLGSGYSQPKGDATVQPPPEYLDYDLWCGVAAVLPYMRARHHRWWRGHRAYGGGTLMDWIGHHNDIAHWALDVDHSGPVKVEIGQWTPPTTEIYNAPWHFDIRSEYADGATITVHDQDRTGIKVVGDDGWVFVTRGKLEASDPRWTKTGFDPGPRKVKHSTDHTQNFLDAVRSRQPCVTSAEIAHRSITPGHLGYVAAAVKRPLRWDPQREQIVGDEEADKLLRSISYRKPWDKLLRDLVPTAL